MPQRSILLSVLVGFSLACIAVSSINILQETIPQTQTALANPISFTPDIAPIETMIPATIEIVPIGPTETKGESENLLITNQPFQTEGSIGEDLFCADILVARLSQEPEYTQHLFEHHAQGVFLVVLLEMTNISDTAFQIWDEDYYVEGPSNNEKLIYYPNKAVTGYLFITRGKNLYQEKIKPGEKWKTYLAFDVDTKETDWSLVLTPGREGGNQICTIRIRISP